MQILKKLIIETSKYKPKLFRNRVADGANRILKMLQMLCH